MKYFFILPITLFLSLPLHAMSPFSQPKIQAGTLAAATAAMLLAPTAGVAELLDNPASKSHALVAALGVTVPFGIAYELVRRGAGWAPVAIAAAAGATNLLILATGNR